MEDSKLDIFERIDLQDCPYCDGPAMLEEENGFCWYVICGDCGSQTAEVTFKTEEERLDAAERAAHLWNIGKVMKTGVGE